MTTRVQEDPVTLTQYGITGQNMDAISFWIKGEDYAVVTLYSDDVTTNPDSEAYYQVTIRSDDYSIIDFYFESEKMVSNYTTSRQTLIYPTKFRQIRISWANGVQLQTGSRVIVDLATSASDSSDSIGFPDGIGIITISCRQTEVQWVFNDSK